MKINNVLLFEDLRVENLYPFSILHCAWEVRSGAFRLYEKVQKLLPEANILFSGRDRHTASFRSRLNPNEVSLTKENTLVFYSGVLPDSSMMKLIRNKYDEFALENGEKSAVFISEGKPVAGFIPAGELINPTERDISFLPRLVGDFFDTIPQIEIPGVKFIRYLWDAIEYNGFSINDDFKYFLPGEQIHKDKLQGIYFVNEKFVSIGKNCSIKPGTVIDASEGPVIIGNSVKIMPNSVIIGPCFIGDCSVIKAGAKIYGQTSIGEYCKIGGEVENSIIHAHSNKQHEGFLGHSYLCEWVNFGADTNTSDLKNTYGEIKVRLENMEIETGRMFLGILCGDHTKSGINTMFTTGTVTGICANIFGSGYPSNYIPSYTWGGIHEKNLFKIDKAIEVAEIVMARRQKKLLPEEKLLLETEHTKSKQFFMLHG